MNLINKLSPIALATSLAVSGMAVPMAANAGFSANATVTTDYLFRGISQTSGEPAIQGGIDYASDVGVYVGTWTSNVGSSDDDNAENEVDIYAGWAGEFGELSVDVGYYLFRYTQEEFFTDYEELAATLSWGPVSFTALQAFDIDVGNGEEDSPYFSIGLDLPITDTVGVSFVAGNWDFDAGQDYSHFDATITKTFADTWDFGFGVSTNDNDTGLGSNSDETTVLVSVGTSFDL